MAAPLALLAMLLAACSTRLPMRRAHHPAAYRAPTSVSSHVIFSPPVLDPAVEVDRLARVRTAPGLLRRSYLELQLQRPSAALESAAQVLFAAKSPSAQNESFARYLRAEAYRLQGHPERAAFDLERARRLAIDPELRRRLDVLEDPAPANAQRWGQLAVQPRDRWQPKPANRRNLDRMQQPRRVTIHHSAMYFRDTRPAACAAQIARIQREHMHNRGYGDIGYHFLIDPSGRVWEGRELRWQGAHASGANNIGNVGICLLGNFVRQRRGQGPTTAQVRSMEQLVIQLMRRYRFGPDALYCHSDFKATQCPGPRMRPLVRQLARQLQARRAYAAPLAEED